MKINNQFTYRTLIKSNKALMPLRDDTVYVLLSQERGIKHMDCFIMESMTDKIRNPGRLFSLSFLAASVLTGCGGGDGGSVSPSPTPSPTTTQQHYDVTVIDGYLQNAHVFMDTNDNGQYDAGEPSGETLDGGAVSLEVPSSIDSSAHLLYALATKENTVDESTGKLVTHDFVLTALPGSQVVTPLTTLTWINTVKNLVQSTAKNSGESSETLAAEALALALETLSSELGVDVDSLQKDYVVTGDAKALYAAESLVASGVMPETVSELVTLLDVSEPEAQAFVSDSAAVSQMVSSSLQVPDEEVSGLPPLFEAPAQDPDGNLLCETGYELVSGVCVVDTDGDGTADVEDDDDDNDGYLDSVDAFPLNETEYQDTDGDLIGNVRDTDDDGDGVSDEDDVFPLDATEWLDNDGDGEGDNADPDDDNDGTDDVDDAFPLDETESVDTDG
ncbi:thrombospondin type 3 repeat-containing protein, partial [Vibrio amylolyticus]